MDYFIEVISRSYSLVTLKSVKICATETYFNSHNELTTQKVMDGPDI